MSDDARCCVQMTVNRHTTLHWTDQCHTDLLSNNTSVLRYLSFVLFCCASLSQSALLTRCVGLSVCLSVNVKSTDKYSSAVRTLHIYLRKGDCDFGSVCLFLFLSVSSITEMVVDESIYNKLCRS